jgi:hypothetical protein
MAGCFGATATWTGVEKELDVRAAAAGNRKTSYLLPAAFTLNLINNNH